MVIEYQKQKPDILLATRLVSFGNVFAQRKLVAALLPHLSWRWHGIGVLQGYVHEDDGGPELRVHIWSRRLMRNGIDTSGNAHNHRFDMRSTVLCGELEHTEWQLRPGTGYARYDFVHARLQTDDNRTAMRRLPGQVAVRFANAIYDKGCTYSFDRGAFHTSTPLSDVVVTLVEKRDQVDERAMVVAPVDVPPVPAFGTDVCGPELIASLLEQAQSELLAAETAR